MTGLPGPGGAAQAGTLFERPSYFVLFSCEPHFVERRLELSIIVEYGMPVICLQICEG